jgi:hypothetical protein
MVFPLLPGCFSSRTDLYRQGPPTVAPIPNPALADSIAKDDLAMKAAFAFCVAVAVLWFVDDRITGGRHTAVVVKAVRSVVGR